MIQDIKYNILRWVFSDQWLHIEHNWSSCLLKQIILT